MNPQKTQKELQDSWKAVMAGPKRIPNNAPATSLQTVAQNNKQKANAAFGENMDANPYSERDVNEYNRVKDAYAKEDLNHPKMKDPNEQDAVNDEVDARLKKQKEYEQLRDQHIEAAQNGRGHDARFLEEVSSTERLADVNSRRAKLGMPMLKVPNFTPNEIAAKLPETPRENSLITQLRNRVEPAPVLASKVK